MKLHAEKGSGNYIQSVTADAVLIRGQAYPVPVIIGAEHIVTGWKAATVADLTMADFAEAFALDPELILLGTGPVHRFASNHLVTAVMARGIGFEVMSTPAACRTYNILTAEDRRVLVALLPG